MNISYESHGSNTFLVVELDADTAVDSMTLGMITNNLIQGVAPAIYTQIDDKRYVKYNISAKVPLSQFFDGPIDRRRLLGVYESIVNALITSSEYMIDSGSFIYDPQYIFVNVSTCDVVMICAPIVDFHQQYSDAGMMFKNIIFTSQFVYTENNDYVGRIINYLNSVSAFSLVEFKAVLEDIKKGNVSTGMPNMSAMYGQQTNMQQTFNQAQQPQNVQMQIGGQQNSFGQSVQQNTFNQQMQQSGFNQQMQQNTFDQQVQQNAFNQQIQQNVQVTAQNQYQQGGTQIQQSTYSVPSGSNSPAQQIDVPTVEQKTNDKKGFSLFGSKKEKEPKEKVTKEKPVKEKPAKVKAEKKAKADKNVTGSAVGYAIPGMVEAPKQVVDAPQVNISAQNVASKQVVSQETQKAGASDMLPYDQIMKNMASKALGENAGSANFGETTVLGGGIGETTVLSAVVNAAISMPYLIRMKNNEKIILNKPVFRIGKEKSYVDYFVNDNTAISRSHANFITKDGAYFVTDTNSTNHTFINGQMIPSNVETPLQHGMKVRLANEDFEFRTY